LGSPKVAGTTILKRLDPSPEGSIAVAGEGHPMTEVAQILKVSEKAIVFHKYRVMASFSLKNNAELVLFALKHHLISS
jgi:DNA-binding NarL/FixJ family response regulator